ncbi:Fe-S cluster assembly sulfur transfer protein SufU [Clostridium omnivorum]|uniref:Iron-sulfur cluster assembly scaffold protein NifU n=1 Tax=Clostridium omnivorum TaxID=1604902 RepID=A0ABQ5N7G5_9CLOT|nr:SUF system NifU family Fe-S cluster assembly protein [Clostridium sp. E14]GLC30985.1 iron-sulfur cluster assembly scaffold protein NifU [Clostridium sp. E14]
MELNSIYTELIMEHSQSSHNRRHLDHADCMERGHNPSCGDDIVLELKLNGDIIEEASFTGSGCAISQASTSMMIDLITGKSKSEALELINTFIGMIKREITDEEELEKLEDAIVLKNISNMPARVKCAVLAWHTLNEVISKK